MPLYQQKNEFSRAKKSHVHCADFVDLVEHEDVSKMTPLHYASFEGNVEFIDFLIDSGADILAKDELGQTPLH